MGNCRLKGNAENTLERTKTDFLFIRIIGRGGFGKVWEVKDKKTNSFYAAKKMSKLKIIKKNSVHSVM